MLTFLSLADAKKPRWIVWENVPGVLSSNGGKDFATFLGALGELGYRFAYRILDAQHFGVAQRRRRVFVVGYLGDWRPAAAVLFERESLSGDSKPSRKKGKETPTNAEGGVGESSDVSCLGGNISPCVTSKWKKGYGGPSGSDETGNMVYVQVAQPVMLDDQGGSVMRVIEDGVCGTLRRETHGHEPCVAQPITMEKIAGPIDASYYKGQGSRQGGEREFVAQPIAVDVYNQTIDGQTSATLTKAVGGTNTSGPKIAQPVHAFKVRGGCEGGGKGYLGQDESAFTISTNQDQHIAEPIAVKNPTIIDRAAFNQEQNAQYEPRIEEGQTMSSLVAKGPHAVQHTMAIRRLTPKECERLQGFPDDWTKIPYRNKPADQCPDGPRYKACGNSMAVPVMRWIGQRIQLIDTILNG